MAILIYWILLFKFCFSQEKLIFQVSSEKEKIKISIKKDESKEENLIYYLVQKGDTLEKIAKKFGVSKEYLMIKNNLKDKNKIYINQKIIVEKESE